MVIDNKNIIKIDLFSESWVNNVNTIWNSIVVFENQSIDKDFDYHWESFCHYLEGDFWKMYFGENVHYLLPNPPKLLILEHKKVPQMRSEKDLRLWVKYAKDSEKAFLESYGDTWRNSLPGNHVLILFPKEIRDVLPDYDEI
jgi:hypothetical protein